MSLSRLASATFVGLDPVLIQVEVDLASASVPSLLIVGLPDAAIRESKDRILAALRNSDHPLTPAACTVNLAPADLKKEGAFYDLPIALGILAVRAGMKELDQYLIAGELGLGGEVRPIRGALALALLAKRLKKKGLIIPAANATEAAAVEGVSLLPARTLAEAWDLVRGRASPQPIVPKPIAPSTPLIDFADVRGQQLAKRALEIAAAGGHNLLMNGPPGSGKTLLARALPGILPPLDLEESLESSRIHSLAGLCDSLLHSRPFRNPHHTISYAGLVGGGSHPRPGEVTLAHNGVLFLDELPEFARSVLEVLRQPLEDGQVTISRVHGHLTFPARFQLVAAMNPCPCGFFTHPTKTCRDTQAQIHRYRSKISGPLLDRIDLSVEVAPLPYQELHGKGPAENSAQILERVLTARERQTHRLGTTNSAMTPRQIQSEPLSAACRQVLEQASVDMDISPRAHFRLLKVARTIADLSGEPHITEDALMEAIALRMSDQR